MHRPATFDPPWIDFFHRPCPYQLKKYTSFPQFSKLPKEMQVEIWKLAAIPQPRMILIDSFSIDAEDDSSDSAGIENGDVNHETTRLCRIKCTVPAVFHACYDSRKAALKNCKLIGKTVSGIPIHFNFDLDMLVFKNIETAELFSDLYRNMMVDNSMLMDSVKYVMVFTDEKVPMSPRIRQVDLLGLCTKFIGLRHLLWVCLSERRFAVCRGGRTITPSIPQTWLHNDNVEVWGQARTGLKPILRWERLDWMMTAIMEQDDDFSGPSFREVDDSWAPPDVTIGTRSEWANLMKQTGGKVGWLEDEKEAWGTLGSNTEDTMECEINAFVPSLDYVPMYGEP